MEKKQGSKVGRPTAIRGRQSWRLVAAFGAVVALLLATADAGKYSGMMDDYGCDYETVNRLNEEVLHPILHELVKTSFFRYFKVKLWCDCPFWPDDGMCHLRDCSVCECPDNEFPELFKEPSKARLADNMACQEGKPQAAVNRTLDNPWTHDDETDNAEMTYANLQLNPERYTGYSGPSARRIWDAIYKEIFSKYPSKESCSEQKVLYKLISGLHSSISVHIASDYLIDEVLQLWDQNLDLLHYRVMRHPERVRNLYFTGWSPNWSPCCHHFKAADYLEQFEYNTGNSQEELKTTQSLVRELVFNPKIRAACPLPIDEAQLWKGEEGPELMHQIQKQFRSISAMMDCVGCEKCRLWGKLQVLGLGTALDILFSDNVTSNLIQPLQLERNEIIALINLLNRLSESVKFVHEMGPRAEKLVKGKVNATPKKNSS
ncbi:hypothetical protein LUZ63_006839 [Rhynchospora breviuscula]|uniref:Endoplasmic reticulum oxidoreductin-1 n=1 Tax=Rhynchospora breviuscula TaxID=2022672 RepID=A0A9Q0CQJ4_9POAL|nr:hypothetical protein LUZ63_006839 [Rhynchospora breviuscula]